MFRGHKEEILSYRVPGDTPQPKPDMVVISVKGPTMRNRVSSITQCRQFFSIIFLAFGLFFSFIFNCYSHPPELDALDKGMAYSKDKNHGEAVREFTKAIEINPDLIEGYVVRGATYLQIGDLDRAIFDYDKVISVNPDFAFAYIQRGTAHLRKHNLDQAMQDFDNAIRLNPNSTVAYKSRGDVYYLKGALDQAIADYDQAISLNGDSVDGVYYMRGTTYVQKGKTDEAINDFTQTILANHDYLEAYVMRGNLYVEKGDLELAMADFDKTVSLQPDYGVGYLGRANVHFVAGDDAKFWEDVHKAESLGVTIPPAFLEKLRKISAVSLSENFQQIDRSLENAFEHARNYPPEFDSEAQRRDLERELQEVIAQLEQMIKDSGPNQEILFRLGKANTFAFNLDMSGSREKADEYFRQLFQLEPHHAEGHLYYGQHLSGRGEFAPAIEHLQTAVDAGLDIALNMIGLAYLGMGKTDEARTYFQKFLGKYPGDPQVQMILDSLEPANEYELRRK